MYYPNLNKEDRILALKRSIESMQSVLPYADGQAYYKDKREIEQMSAELAYLLKEQE
jgi:hypothetical protein